MLDPQLSGAQLQELAATRPDLWDLIAAHPNCYPALEAWIERKQAAEQSQSQPVTQTQPVTHTQPAAQIQTEQSAQPQPEIQPVTQTQPEIQPQPDMQPDVPASAVQASAGIPQMTPSEPKGEKGKATPSGKKRKGVVVAIVAVVVLALVAGGGIGAYFWFFRGNDSGYEAAVKQNISYAGIKDKLQFTKTQMPDGQAAAMIVPTVDSNMILTTDQKPYLWKGQKAQVDDQIKVNANAPLGVFTAATGTYAPRVGSFNAKGKAIKTQGIPWGVKANGNPFQVQSSGGATKLDEGKFTLSNPDIDASSEKGKEIEEAFKDLKGRPQWNGTVGGTNGSSLCTVAKEKATCQAIITMPNELAAQQNPKDRSAKNVKLAKTIEFKIPAGSTQVGAFPLDDGMAVIHVNENKRVVDIVDESGKANTQILTDSILTNLFEFAGYSADFKQRVIPVPTNGLTVKALETAVKDKVAKIKVMGGKVFTKAKDSENLWKLSGGNAQFKGMIIPVSADKDYVVGLWGMPSADLHPVGKGLAIYQISDGKELKRYSFDQPGSVSEVGGKFFVNAKDAKGKPFVYEYAAKIEAKDQKVADAKPADPKDPNAEKPLGWDAIKKIDFANYTSKRNDSQGKPFWQMSGGKQTINQYESATYQSDKTAYVDINNDGYLDAITFSLSYMSMGTQMAPPGYNTRVTVWLWDAKAGVPEAVWGWAASLGDNTSSSPDKNASLQAINKIISVQNNSVMLKGKKAVWQYGFWVYPETGTSLTPDAVDVMEMDPHYTYSQDKAFAAPDTRASKPKVSLSGQCINVHTFNPYTSIEKNGFVLVRCTSSDGNAYGVWLKK